MILIALHVVSKELELPVSANILKSKLSLLSALKLLLNVFLPVAGKRHYVDAEVMNASPLAKARASNKVANMQPNMIWPLHFRSSTRIYVQCDSNFR
jgi:hypothetical protein